MNLKVAVCNLTKRISLNLSTGDHLSIQTLVAYMRREHYVAHLLTLHAIALHTGVDKDILCHGYNIVKRSVRLDACESGKQSMSESAVETDPDASKTAAL